MKYRSWGHGSCIFLLVSQRYIFIWNFNLLPLIGLEILPWTKMFTWSMNVQTTRTLYAPGRPGPQGHKNVCCGYSLQQPHWGDSNEYIYQMFYGEPNKLSFNYHPIPSLSVSLYLLKCHHMSSIIWNAITWALLYQMPSHELHYMKCHHMSSIIWNAITWAPLCELPSYELHYVNCNHMSSIMWIAIIWAPLCELPSYELHYVNCHHMSSIMWNAIIWAPLCELLSYELH